MKNNPLPKKLRQSVELEAKSRASELLAGVLKYIETPYTRSPSLEPVIWRRGSARLIDYGMNSINSDHSAPVSLFIPSLINRYYILDLEENRSLLKFMAQQGVYPLVLDWGTPSETESDFDIADYVTEILLPAIEFIRRTTGRTVSLVGYCMGGVFALAAARLKPKDISSLALLATPWNFHCKRFEPFIIDPNWQHAIATLIDKRDMLPADAVQALFYLTDPWIFEQKFRRFAALQDDSRAARDFIALEHWVNDGVAMTSGVAHDCLIGWAQQNKLAKNTWCVAGKTISPKTIQQPTLIAIPQNDHVVPRDCAYPLTQLIPNAITLEPPSGHVGMIVGHHAKRALWTPLAEWLLQ